MAILAVTVGGLEIMLRALPELVPLSLLVRFEQGIRTEIAQARNFPTGDVMRDLPRQDGGPPLRLYPPFGRISTTQQDTETPDPAPLDGNGFCNPDHALATAERIDVAAIGDSFTYCTAVPPQNMWPAQLAARTGLSVYNLGRPSSGLYEYLEMYRVFLATKSPRIVIMNVYEGNDLRDAVRYHAYVADGRERSTDQAGRREAKAVRNAMGRVSYAYNLIATGVVSLRESLSNRRKSKGEDPEKNVDFRYTLQFPDGKVEFNPDNNDRDEVVYARRLVSGELSVAMFDKALERFAAMARTGGFQPLVIYSPSAYTAYGRNVRFADPELQVLMPKYSSILRSYFAASAERFGYRFLDLTPLLQSEIERAGKDRLLYFPRNVHYTSAGSAAIAGWLAPVVGEMLK
ncbi:MAG: hypothetical protein AB7F36_01885 [Reyranellaceae bacterium]